jgi:hypothetical protein
MGDGLGAPSTRTRSDDPLPPAPSLAAQVRSSSNMTHADVQILEASKASLKSNQSLPSSVAPELQALQFASHSGLGSDADAASFQLLNNMMPTEVGP